MFDGVDIMTVAAGTEIEHNGEKLIVSDENVVFKGRKVYVTERTFNALKKHPGLTNEKSPRTN